MKALIFAAGLGTRLKPITDICPKALVKVNNKTLLEHNLRYLQQFGIHNVIINVHHFADAIESELQNNEGFGSSYAISDERNELLETGGGLKKVAPFFRCEEIFVVMNVDVLTTLDLSQLIRFHKETEPIVTLAVMDRPSSRQLLFDGEMNLCGWVNHKTNEKRIVKEKENLKEFAFSGIQVLSGKMLNNIPFSGKFSIIDLYLHLAAHETIKGFDHSGDIFVDVGKQESIALAEKYFH